MNTIKYIEGFFFSKLLSKLVNKLCFKGKKFYIEKILYYTFFLLKKKLRYYSLFIFFEVLEKIKPSIGLKLYKYKRGKKKKINAFPCLLNNSSQYKKSIEWLTKSIILRKEKKLYIKIYNELYNTLLNNPTYSLKKKKDYYKYVTLYKTVKKFKW